MASTTMGQHAREERDRIPLTGWATFGSVTLMTVGAINAINGFTALHNADYFRSDIVYSNLTFWGWAFLIWGILEVVAGGLVLARSVAGYYMGVCLAATAAILWFFLIFAAPWPALLGVLLSLLVIYSLTIGSEEALN